MLMGQEEGRVISLNPLLFDLSFVHVLSYCHFLQIPPLKVDYTLPSPLIGRDPSSAPDAPWVPGSPLPEEMEDSENEEQDVDEKKRQEAKMKRAEEKLTKLRLEFHLRTVSFSKDASFDIYFRDEDGRFLL